MKDYGPQQTQEETRTIELMGLPRGGGFGNLIAAFDQLDPGGALLIVDNRDLSWILKLFRDVRDDELDLVQSHAFEKPENYFLYLVKATP